MYSSYGSYGSMSSVTQPLDIAPSSYLSQNSSYHASCAFPSWPRRSSLSDPANDERATSYLSDDDLFPCDLEDDAHSVSSASSTAPTSPFAVVNEEEVLEMQRQQMAMQREAMKFMLSEKERRRRQQQQQLKRRRSSSGSSSKKNSPNNKSSSLVPITEAGE